MRAPFSNLPYLLAAWLAVAGCHSTDHDLLAARDAGPGSPSGQVSEAGDAIADHDADEPEPRDANAPDVVSKVHPDGDSTIVFVHGVVDLGDVWVCVQVKEQSGAEHALAAQPLPGGKGGSPLGYARTLSLPTAAGSDAGAAYGELFRFVLVPADASHRDRPNCEKLDDGKSPDKPVQLPWVPSSVFRTGRFLILVAAGCVSSPAPARDGGVDEWKAACGPSDAGGPILFAASPDRVTERQHIGMQVLQSSVASGPLTIRYVPDRGRAAAISLAGRAAVGGLSPASPSFRLSRSSLGASPEVGRFDVFGDPSNTEAAISVELLQALDNGGLQLQDLTDGSSFVFVTVGPVAGTKPHPALHPFTGVLVRTTSR